MAGAGVVAGVLMDGEALLMVGVAGKVMGGVGAGIVGEVLAGVGSAGVVSVGVVTAGGVLTAAGKGDGDTAKQAQPLRIQVSFGASQHTAVCSLDNSPLRANLPGKNSARMALITCATSFEAFSSALTRAP